jgi:imidazoleglycerol phosphate synthase glutamine amidotransferase subunit HisH
VRQGNFVGMQFHPERSGATGARLLANFLQAA